MSDSGLVAAITRLSESVDRLAAAVENSCDPSGNGAKRYLEGAVGAEGGTLKIARMHHKEAYNFDEFLDRTQHELCAQYMIEMRGMVATVNLRCVRREANGCTVVYRSIAGQVNIGSRAITGTVDEVFNELGVIVMATQLPDVDRQLAEIIRVGWIELENA
jgi:hypothetical protein